MTNSGRIQIIDTRPLQIIVPALLWTEYRPVLGRVAVDVYMQLLVDSESSTTRAMRLTSLEALADKCDLSIKELKKNLYLLRAASLVLLKVTAEQVLLSLIDIEPINKQSLAQNITLDYDDIADCGDAVLARLYSKSPSGVTA